MQKQPEGRVGIILGVYIVPAMFVQNIVKTTEVILVENSNFFSICDTIRRDRKRSALENSKMIRNRISKNSAFVFLVIFYFRDLFFTRQTLF